MYRFPVQTLPDEKLDGVLAHLASCEGSAIDALLDKIYKILALLRGIYSVCIGECNRRGI